MKKIICLLLVLLMIGCFAACGDYSSSGSTSCGHASCAENGPFYCMGKGNTCTNRTSCAYDLYCSACD